MLSAAAFSSCISSSNCCFSGLPGAQQLVVAEKDLNGRVTTKEIMPVLFSVLEESDQPAFRAS